MSWEYGQPLRQDSSKTNNTVASLLVRLLLRQVTWCVRHYVMCRPHAQLRPRRTTPQQVSACIDLCSCATCQVRPYGSLLTWAESLGGSVVGWLVLCLCNTTRCPATKVCSAVWLGSLVLCMCIACVPAHSALCLGGESLRCAQGKNLGQP